MPKEIPASFPVIVSASRATDIPAFHADWLMRRWREGSVLWRNPFNNSTVEVSFAKTRFIVFWSKNPKPVFKFLDEIARSGVGFYFQFTLNDYEKERLEPGVPPLAERLESFIELSERLGPDAAIWRFDPIILSDKLPPEAVLERISKIAEKLKGHARKLVVSFADIEKYKNVKRSLLESLHSWREPSLEDVHILASGLESIAESCGLAVATCAEKVDLSGYGISHNRCIDGELILKLSPDDLELRDFLSKAVKDKGQRKDCLCVKSKDIGRYSTCPHRCLYCYANSSSLCGMDED